MNFAQTDEANGAGEFAEISVTVLAHNEEKRIAACLTSILAEPGSFTIHVVVNGSTDKSAEIARSLGPRITVHEFKQGGKARSWNRFVFEQLSEYCETHIFMDGDAEIAKGSIAALQDALRANPEAKAASAIPLNGRRAAYYMKQIQSRHGLFGDLYALRGQFLREMALQNIRLPEDLIGDDGLLGALAKTDLKDESHWQNERLAVCRNAGFYCAPVKLHSPSTWRMQYKRQVNYSIRHFQNRIISEIMRSSGPAALPKMLASLYGNYMNQFSPRKTPSLFWFDAIALRLMREAAKKDTAQAQLGTYQFTGPLGELT
jgi:glycosyltransferase involved in cell wall biosynthesis